MNDIFISYRRSDAPDAVARLHERLAARLRNRPVFYDHASLDLGDVFPDVLRQRVTAAGVVLVVIGPNWATELKKRAADTSKIDFVREEVRLALASGHTVIPVLVGGAMMPSEDDFAKCPELLPLRALNAQTVRPDPLFAAECDKLIAHLERTGPSDIAGTILGGKYKVLRLVAVGGMGEVYEAAQTDMKRTVAVKLIKAGMDSKEVLARFDAERQALAVMDHPNVCKVLDAGTAPNGRPFFVMEFVRGVPITQFCDDRKLPPKERLALFTDVCKAVQHAHQKGIIHRDIKPGNVLVEVIDGKPVPKVIDFGLAKALGRKLTDQSMAATEYGQWVGTLEYSSPEQAEGRYDIDTLTDVYSLGALLHELLVGSPPFTREELLKASEDEMRRVIREVEPTAPSTRLSSSKNLPAIAASRHLDPTALAKALRGELDWIILKALSKEKNGRYETPTALADDIHRHLTDQPISAGKPSAWVRLRKFYRRNRPQVIAGVLVAAALLVGMIGTTMGLLESERQKGIAEANARTAREEAEAKEQARAEAVRQTSIATAAQKETAEQLVKTVQAEGEAKAKRKEAEASLAVARERTKSLSDAYSEFVFGIQNKLDNRPGTQELRKQLLEIARTGLKKILDDARKQGTPDHTLVTTYFGMGDLEMRLGNTTAAQKEYQAGHELAKRLAEADPDDALTQRDLSVSFDKLGDVCQQLEQPKNALSYYQKALAIREKLTRADPKDDWAHRALSLSLDKIGDVNLQLGETTIALDYYIRHNKIAQQLADAAPEDFRAQLALSVSFENIGDVCLRLGLDMDALDDYTKGLDIRQKLADADPKNTRAQLALTFSFDKLGEVYLKLGRTKDALAHYQKGLGVRQKLADADPENTLAQRAHSVALGDYGDVCLKLGQAKEALEYYLKHNESAQKLADADPKDVEIQRLLSISFERVGDATLQLGQTKDALAYYQKGLSVTQKLADANPTDAKAQRALIFSFSILGDAAQSIDDYPTAIEWYEKGIAVAKKFHKPVVFEEDVAVLKQHVAECKTKVEKKDKK